MRVCVLFFILLANLGAIAPASAATVTITAKEVGSDVIVDGSGSFDLSGSTLTPFLGAIPGIIPFRGIIGVGVGSFTHEFYNFGPAVFPMLGQKNVFDFPNTEAGDYFVLTRDSFDALFLGLPQGYVSLSSLSASNIYANATFASMDVNVGTYNWVFGNNTVTLVVGPGDLSEVPLPAAFVFFLAGLSSLGIAQQIKVQKQKLPLRRLDL